MSSAIRARLARTTALRVSLIYAALFTLVTAAALAVVYWNASQYIEAQIETGLSTELSSFARQSQSQSIASLVDTVEKHAASAPETRRYYLLVSAEGRRLAGNLAAWPDGFSTDGSPHNLWLDDKLIPGQINDEDQFATAIAARLAHGSRVFIAQGISKVEALTDYTLNTILTTLAVAAFIAVAMGIQMGRTMLARVDGISGTLAGIMQGDLSRRIGLSGRGDEFDELSARLNAMLERIEQLMKGMRQVTENVAHDLRSPLSRLRSRLEVTLLRQRDNQVYVAVIEEAIDEIEQLLRTFNTMLRIAQAESGSYRTDLHDLDLGSLAADMADLYRTLAEGKSQTLTVSIRDNVFIKGDRDLLAQALGNLIENAVKFTPEQGAIRIDVEEDGDDALLTVSDSGPGIPAAARTQVFERFTRLDPARTLPGNGLGLSLVRAVAQIHGAAIDLLDNHPGLRVALRFRKQPHVAIAASVAGTP